MKIGHGELDKKSLPEVCVVLLEHFYRDLTAKVLVDIAKREVQAEEA